MARSGVNLFEKHVEKIVLGVAAFALAGAAIMYLGRSPYQNAEGLSPSTVCDDAARTAEEIAQKVRNRSAKAEAQPTIVTDLGKYFEVPPRGGLLVVGKMKDRAEPLQPWQPPLVDLVGTSKSDRVELARILAPEKPVVRAGHSTFKLGPPPDLAHVDAPGSATEDTPDQPHNWVNVVAQVDLLEQGRMFRAARYGTGKYELNVFDVHLQRRLAHDANAAWEDVSVYRPYQPIALPKLEFTPEGRLTGDSASELFALRKSLKEATDFIARALLPDPIGGEQPIYAEVPWLREDPQSEEQADKKAGAAAPTQGRGGRGGMSDAKGAGGALGGAARSNEPIPVRRFNRWLKAADAELKGSTSRKTDLDLAAILLEAALGEEGVDEALRKKAHDKWDELARKRQAAQLPPLRKTFRRPEKMMPIIASDFDVPAGRSFVYRIRYEILNPYAGEPKELRNAEDARRVVLASEWSEPSAPVEVRTDVYFFVTAVQPERHAATVMVFKNQARSWVSATFNVAIGEPIGSPKRSAKAGKVDFFAKAVVVDVLPAASGGEGGGRLIYMDQSDGRLYERNVREDLANPKYQELSSKKVASRE